MSSKQKIPPALRPAAREHELSENTRRPLPIWVIVVCGLIGILAGGMLGQARLFGYSSFTPDGYVTGRPPGMSADEIMPRPIRDLLMRHGAKVFVAKCSPCHGMNGLGDETNYPPLAGSEWPTGPTERFSQIILHGLTGDIAIKNKVWTGKQMPPQAAGMSPKDLASVMTYVRNSFGNQTPGVITPSMAKSAFSARQGATTPMTVEELNASFNKDLPGEPVAPETLANPETFELLPARASLPAPQAK